MTAQNITKAALVVFNDRGHVLMTREASKTTFAFPGGKVDPHESVEEALKREIREELSTSVVSSSEVGVATGRTGDGRGLTIHMFTGQLVDEPRGSGDIVELMWASAEQIRANIGEAFTSITRGACFDILVKNGLR